MTFLQQLFPHFIAKIEIKERLSCNLIVFCLLNKIMKLFKSLFLTSLIVVFLNSCGMYQKVDQRQMPDTAKERARKNVNEGRGTNIGSILKNRGKTNYEFSTSNPMWRASLETLDFLPLTTVDYSGGIIITDWYYNEQGSASEAIKISLRFLSNDIRSESLKIIVHKKTCKTNNNCQISLLNETSIKEELHASILKKASLLEKKDKEQKK